MALQISQFNGVAASRAAQLDLPDGLTNVDNVTGEFTTAPSTVLIRIQGTGTITWQNIITPENFDGVEFRRVRGATTFTVG